MEIRNKLLYVRTIRAGVLLLSIVAVVPPQTIYLRNLRLELETD